MRNLAVTFAIFICGCGQGGGGDEATTVATNTTLTLQHDEQGLSGSFRAPDGTELTFRSSVSGDVLTLTIDVNALLTLTSIVNRATRHADYEVPDGAVLTDRDSKNLNLLYRALLEKFGTDKQDDPEVEGLVALTGMWAEKSTGAQVTVRIDLPKTQGWTSLCSQVFTWVWGDHDCQYFGWGQDPKPVNIGPWDTSSIPNHNGTAYANWVNGGWSYPDQGWAYNSVPTGVGYEWGNCYGECGAGCGSPDYTVDCLNHDHCVRNHGHWIGSGYCDDQFAACTDDSLPTWLGGAPNCW
jgi:hypothetical protein